MLTVNKEILLHPDFAENFEKNIIEFLEALIDAEFEKGDETDFDFIDECADAINAVRSGDTAAVLPVISRRDFMQKIKGGSNGRLKALLAVCAAAAVLLAVNAANPISETKLVKDFSGYISELFGRKPVQIPLTEPYKTTVTEKDEPVLTGISVETTDEFKTEYYVGEEFSSAGIRVFAEFDNGERRLVTSRELSIDVAESFGSEAGYETVVIRSGGFEKTLEVRIIESLSTPKLTSVYALFPEDFAFTAEDIENITLDGMRVFAVYSNKTEKELSAEEYEITVETERTLFEQCSWVTVSYGECSCSFRIMKE